MPTEPFGGGAATMAMHQCAGNLLAQLTLVCVRKPCLIEVRLGPLAADDRGSEGPGLVLEALLEKCRAFFFSFVGA